MNLIFPVNTASASLENYYGLTYCLETGVCNSKPQTNGISTGGITKKYNIYIVKPSYRMYGVLFRSKKDILSVLLH